MKKILVLAVMLSSFSAFGFEKVITCTKKSNAEESLLLTYETQSLIVKSVTLKGAEIDGGIAQVLRPIGQTPWQNFAFLVALPVGRSLLVPFSVFTVSPTAEVILDGSIQYRCK